MKRSRVVVADALVAAALLVAASCGRTEERTAPPSSPEVTASPTETESSSPTESPVPTVSPTPTGSPTAAEPSGRMWHRSLDFSVEAVAADAEGNAYVTGFVPFGPAEEWGEPVAMMLVKSDPGGRQVWIRTWQSTSERYPHAAGFDVAVSPDGSLVYAAGAVMNDSTEVRRGRLWAYSPDGSLLWSERTFRHVMESAAAASSTGVVVGGGGSLGAWGPDGSPSWVESFEDPKGEHCDQVENVAIGDGGEIYAVGFLDTTPTCGSIEGGAYEDADIVIQKRASSGDLLWSRVLADPGVTDNDWAHAVDVAGRRILVAGGAGSRAWLARVSPGGEIVWERSWGETGTMVSAVDVAPWGAVYVAVGDHLRRYTPGGDLVWERRLRPDEEGVPSGVATALGRVLYVTAGGGFSVQKGDLWRMRP